MTNAEKFFLVFGLHPCYGEKRAFRGEQYGVECPYANCDGCKYAVDGEGCKRADWWQEEYIEDAPIPLLNWKGEEE